MYASLSDEVIPPVIFFQPEIGAVHIIFRFPCTSVFMNFSKFTKTVRNDPDLGDEQGNFFVPSSLFGFRSVRPIFAGCKVHFCGLFCKHLSC